MASIKMVGNQVRIARGEQGLSPEQFGAKYGVSGNTIRRLEDGRQTRLTSRSMLKISQGIGVPVGELFDL